jgi:hypothetical protein
VGLASGKYPAPTAGQSVAVILGNAPNIRPQQADTWSAGFDIAPPVIPGLNISLTYWSIVYNDVTALPDFTNTLNFWTNSASSSQRTRRLTVSAALRINRELPTRAP